MPDGDRTGPAGYGSRTGRGLGYCSGYNISGFTKGNLRGRGGFGRGWGRGSGRGFWGRGRGFWRRDYYQDHYYELDPYDRDTNPESNKDKEKSYFEAMVKGLEGELKSIKERLQLLSKEKKDET